MNRDAPTASNQIRLRPIGAVRTPYKDKVPRPFETVEADRGEFRLVVFDEYREGLKDLEHFGYIYVLAYLDRPSRPYAMTVTPPWAGGKWVGLFASRSPCRPNPIGLTVVRLFGIDRNELVISPIDLLDGTPLLDIKPYFRELDAKVDADQGWAEGLGKHRVDLTQSRDG